MQINRARGIPSTASDKVQSYILEGMGKVSQGNTQTAIGAWGLWALPIFEHPSLARGRGGDLAPQLAAPGFFVWR